MNEGKDLEGMKNFIHENAEVPKENIGELGEQFTKALFKDVDIKKNTPPLPDFTIILNKNAFSLETTVIGKIYRDPSEIFYDACKEIENKNLASEYSMSVDPYNIRREDEENFKEGLKKILNVIQKNRFEHRKFPIKADIGSYTVEFEKSGRDTTMLTFGTIDNPASNLINTLTKKGKNKQIEKSDILFLIILNDLIEKEFELLDVLYKPISVGINVLEKGSENKLSLNIVLRKLYGSIQD
ncbi:hypothetical protein C5S36_08240 [Candidatus Methanophagaceae archaeon]|nr:hypothetical protein C5S36_08240 [Methanophagales archaeon]